MLPQALQGVLTHTQVGEPFSSQTGSQGLRPLEGDHDNLGNICQLLSTGRSPHSLRRDRSPGVTTLQHGSRAYALEHCLTPPRRKLPSHSHFRSTAPCEPAWQRHALPWEVTTAACACQKQEEEDTQRETLTHRNRQRVLEYLKPPGGPMAVRRGLWKSSP